MSSAAAGKFQDHYEVLGVDHKAEMAAVQTAYSRMAEKYHPKTGTMPDQEKFESLNLAIEVLSDPDLRRDFDKLKGIGGDEKPRFSGSAFFEAYGRDNHLRTALLCVLYDRRRSRPFTPSLSMRHLEAIFNVTTVELNFALWYLKQREMVMADDKSSLQITADGMDYLQAHPPVPTEVLRMIKEDGQVQPQAADAPAESARPALASAPALANALAAEETASRVVSGHMSTTAARIGDMLAKRK